MGGAKSDKTKASGDAKITAAHLAGLRPRPVVAPKSERWDRSTAFVTGLALAGLTFPELSPVLGLGSVRGVPHPALDLALVLGVVGFFGIFPVVILHHVYLQKAGPALSPWNRAGSALVALAAMYAATGAMKPLVGYHAKIAEDRRYVEESTAPSRRDFVFGEATRSPASAPAAAIREGTDLYR